MMVDVSYKLFIRQLAKNHDSRVFLNSDEDHALAVFVQLFQIAQKEIKIFAGCLCKHVGNQTEYVVALSEFIERGGAIRILLNDYDENAAKESTLYKRLAYYISKGYPVEVKTTTARPYLSNDPDKKPIHFTEVDGVAYRLETDIDKRTAECSLNNPAMAGAIATFFDGLYNREGTVLVDVVALFDDDNQ